MFFIFYMLQSYDATKRFSTKDWKRKFFVKFDGEEGKEKRIAYCLHLIVLVNERVRKQ